MSHSDEQEDCAICLLPLLSDPPATQQELGQLDCPTAVHTYHLECLSRWSEVTNSCPKDRSLFNKIRVVETLPGTTIRVVQVEDKIQGVAAHLQEHDGLEDELFGFAEEDLCECMICGRTDREDIMLLCDICDQGWHMDCLGLSDFPEGEWYCPECEPTPAEVLPSNRRTRRTNVDTTQHDTHARHAATGTPSRPYQAAPRPSTSTRSRSYRHGRGFVNLITQVRRQVRQTNRSQQAYIPRVSHVPPPPALPSSNYFTPSGDVRDIPAWLQEEQQNTINLANSGRQAPNTRRLQYELRKEPIYLGIERRVNANRNSDENIGSRRLEKDLESDLWQQLERAKKIQGKAAESSPVGTPGKRKRGSRDEGAGPSSSRRTPMDGLKTSRSASSLSSLRRSRIPSANSTAKPQPKRRNTAPESCPASQSHPSSSSFDRITTNTPASSSSSSYSPPIITPPSISPSFETHHQQHGKPPRLVSELLDEDGYRISQVGSSSTNQKGKDRLYPTPTPQQEDLAFLRRDLSGFSFKRKGNIDGGTPNGSVTVSAGASNGIDHQMPTPQPENLSFLKRDLTGIGFERTGNMDSGVIPNEATTVTVSESNTDSPTPSKTMTTAKEKGKGKLHFKPTKSVFDAIHATAKNHMDEYWEKGFPSPSDPNTKLRIDRSTYKEILKNVVHAIWEGVKKGDVGSDEVERRASEWVTRDVGRAVGGR